MRERVLEPELMDDPALNGRRHTTALRGLARLNRLSSAGAAVYGCLEDLIERATPGRPLRVLDVASGGGDVAIALAKQGKDRVAVHGCDISKRAVQRANAAARREGVEAMFFVSDALADELPTDYDVLTCSLFLHHLTTEQAQHLLTRMAEAASRRVVVNDLQRSWFNLAAVSLGARLVTRSRIVHTDGARSVRAAFTARELQSLAVRAGLLDAVVRKRFPCRLLLTWSRT